MSSRRDSIPFLILRLIGLIGIAVIATMRHRQVMRTVEQWQPWGNYAIRSRLNDRAHKAAMSGQFDKARKIRKLADNYPFEGEKQ